MTSPTPEYREITLTQGQVARVSPHRFAEISASKWSARWSKNTQTFYALRSSKKHEGPKHTILMHRQIKGVGYKDPREVDHVNNKETLDNTDENLRFANDTEQMCNHGIRKDNSSGLKGVSFHKATGKWQAQIQVNGKKIYLGLFDTKELAHAAFVEAAMKYHGKFACTG